MTKDAIKTFVKRHPLLLKFYRALRQGKAFNSSYKRNIKGFNNQLRLNRAALLYNSRFDIFGDSNEIVVETSTMLKNVRFYIKGNHNRIYISGDVEFRNGGLLWIEDDNCLIEIGKGSTFNGHTHLAATEPNSVLSVGEDCMFAYDIDVRTGDSHSIIDLNTNKRINYAKDVIIGNHVWIAAHVTILKGSIISPDSVVATRSVVTKDFKKSNVLIGGSPAKILKERITWDRKRIYDT